MVMINVNEFEKLDENDLGPAIRQFDGELCDRGSGFQMWLGDVVQFGWTCREDEQMSIQIMLM